MTRRQVIAKTGGGLLAIGVLPAVLAACGSDDSSSDSTGDSGGAPSAGEITGTITMINYAGWMGKNQVRDFRNRYPGADVDQATNVDAGSSATVLKIRQNPGAYDFALAGLATAGHLEEAEILEPFDPDRVPNLAKNIPDQIRELYPWGIPTDYGRMGFGYRKDLIEERPTTWAELWELAPKYSGKLTFLDYDVDIMGLTLKSLGYSVNTTDKAELQEARDKLIEIKPDVRAFLSTDSAKPLIQGSAVIGVTYDYEIANAQKEESNIVWVDPEEGTSAYMDGWSPLLGTENMDTVYGFMNFSLEPKIYADFINTIGAAYIMPAAEPYIDKSITSNEALAFDPDTIDKVEFVAFKDPEATRLTASYWEEVKAS